MPLPLAALGLIPAGAQAILGTIQYLNAIKQAKQNQRPSYSINPEYQQNLDTLTNTMGLPQSALDSYYRNAGQAGTSGINAILASGGNPNMIAGLVNNQLRNYQDVAAQDALQRKSDIGGINNARTALAGERDKAWMLNEYAPYADKAAAISQQKGAGLQNIFGALNSASGALANTATEKLASTTTRNPRTGVDISKIVETLKFSNPSFNSPQPNAFNFNTSAPSLQQQGDFGNYNSLAPYLNLGGNNLQYGMPNYSLNAPLFGGNNQSQFNPMDYSFLFKNNLF